MGGEVLGGVAGSRPGHAKFEMPIRHRVEMLNGRLGEPGGRGRSLAADPNVNVVGMNVAGV